MAKLVPGFYQIGTWVLPNWYLGSAEHLLRVENFSPTSVANNVRHYPLNGAANTLIEDDDRKGTLGTLGRPPRLGLWQCL